MLEPELPTLYAFTDSLDGETRVVVGNCSSTELELPLAIAGELVVGNWVIGNNDEVPDVAGRRGRRKCGFSGGCEGNHHYFCTTSEPAMR